MKPPAKIRPFLFAMTALTACQSSGTPPAEVPKDRRYELERVDQAAVVQLWADGFEALPQKDRVLCYHLAQAAIAGRDINLDQRFAYNLGIRWVLESLYLVKDKLAPDVAKEVERYTKLFWIHNGIHDNHSTQKNLLALSWEQFDAACETARHNGINMAAQLLAPGRPSDAVSQERIGELQDRRKLYAILTEPNLYRSVTDKSPEGGADPVAASCNNLYVGCTTADLAEFKEDHPLNSRVVKQGNGKLAEQVYRCGDGQKIAPGLYEQELSLVNRHLRAALPYAPEPTQKALRHLIRYNETGDPADWQQFNIAWVQDKDSAVDFILGFVEVYLDVRGQKGSWEGIISYRDPQQSRDIAALAAEAKWFEQRMPWEERFKKAEVKGISARAINVVTETGDSGPITPVGINLPNEADIREQYGSKSVNLGNVVDAYNRSQAKGSAAEFSVSPEEASRAEKYAAAMDNLHTNLHEVIGHASGQVLPEVKNPAQMLGLFYSTLEEARADLVGLYWIADQKLKDMKLVPNDDAVLAKYEAYARNALVQLRRVPKGGKIEEDHMRNRQMIVHWLIANGGGVQVEQRDGKTFYRVTSIAAFRDGCGKLLGEVMRVKATGDFTGGKALVDSYGTKVDPKLHEEVLARVAKLNLPSVTGFVQPELRPVMDTSGKVVDATVFHPCDLADQMLRWSGRR